MNAALSNAVLVHENWVYRGSGGRSEENSGQGFRPAFLDTETHAIYPSCFSDGRPAPFHLIDGLPDDLIVARFSSGKVAEVKASVISGFVRERRFYSRDEAAQCVAEQTT